MVQVCWVGTMIQSSGDIMGDKITRWEKLGNGTFVRRESEAWN